MSLTLNSAIETQRYILRVVHKDDIEDLFLMNKNDVVTKFLPYASWKTVEDGYAWLSRIVQLSADGSTLQLVVVDKETRRAIASCLLFHFDANNQVVELGYALHPDFWGRGVMSGVLQVLISYAFEQLKIRRIEARVDPENSSSNHIIQRLGFVLEGVLRQRVISKSNLPCDMNIYGLLKSDWVEQLSGPAQTQAERVCP